jgi:murein DD-endopeptidase MepM/ murein hydrolase activator NlpD
VRAELVVLALMASAAYADDEPRPAARTAATKHEAVDPRTALAGQLAGETDVLARTRATIADKLATVDTARAARVRAAYRVLCDPLDPDATADERMAAARRRAAARLMLARDASEHAQLAGEATLLSAADARTVEATTKLAAITLPTDLAWPAHGTIARHFGTFEHERTKAMLSRRGIDLEVDDHATASAPADGVVRFAGPIRGLDHGVIVDHGDYFTVIAKLGELSVLTGAPVHRGDRVGRAARHRVYFEVRARIGPGGLPIDPESVFAKPAKR